MPRGRSENPATAPARIPYRLSSEHVQTTHRVVDVHGREYRQSIVQAEDAGVLFLVPSAPLSVVADPARIDVHAEIPLRIVTRRFRSERRSAMAHADRRNQREDHSGFMRSPSADMAIRLVDAVAPRRA